MTFIRNKERKKTKWYKAKKEIIIYMLSLNRSKMILNECFHNKYLINRF